MTKVEAVATVVAAIGSDRPRVEAMLEILIALLDLTDGDSDFEDDSEDCCNAGDDIGTDEKMVPDGTRCQYGLGFPGDPEDAEPDYQHAGGAEHPAHALQDPEGYRTRHGLDIVPVKFLQGGRDLDLGRRSLRDRQPSCAVGEKPPREDETACSDNSDFPRTHNSHHEKTATA